MNVSEALEEKKATTKKPFFCKIGFHRWGISPVFDVVETEQYKEKWVVMYCSKCFEHVRLGLASAQEK